MRVIHQRQRGQILAPISLNLPQRHLRTLCTPTPEGEALHTTALNRHTLAASPSSVRRLASASSRSFSRLDFLTEAEV